MSETVIPKRKTEVPTLKADMFGGLDAELAEMERIIVEREAVKWQAKVAELEREVEELRCPLTSESHEFEKLCQHYCPYWGKVGEQATAIARLTEALRDLFVASRDGGPTAWKLAMREAQAILTPQEGNKL